MSAAGNMLYHLNETKMLMEHLPFILTCLKRLPRTPLAPGPVEFCDALRRRCMDENVGVWVQTDPKGRGLLMCVSELVRSFTGERRGMVFALVCEPGADTRRFWERTLRPWFEGFGVEIVLCNDNTFTQGKERWLRRYKFQPVSKVHYVEI